MHFMEYYFASIILCKMKKWGACIYYKASTGSIYIKFNHWNLGYMRVADHNGRKRCRYRWILDIREENKDKFEIYTYKGIRRCIFGVNAVDRFISAFEKQAKENNIHVGDKQTYKEYLCQKKKKRK